MANSAEHNNQTWLILVDNSCSWLIMTNNGICNHDNRYEPLTDSESDM